MSIVPGEKVGGKATEAEKLLVALDPGLVIVVLVILPKVVKFCQSVPTVQVAVAPLLRVIAGAPAGGWGEG